MSSDDIKHALGALGQAASAVSTAKQAVSIARDAGNALAQYFQGENHNVEYGITIQGVTDTLSVIHFEISDGINRAYEIKVRLGVPTSAHIDAAELPLKDCSITLERPQQFQTYKGFIRDAQLMESGHNPELWLTIGPLLWTLGRDLDTRIYQNETAPDVVCELYDRLLGTRGRTVRNDCGATYPEREYIVQYQESNLAFLTRLCEEEGFFFYFDHEEEGNEVLVLADASKGRGEARDGEVTHFWHDARQAPDGEAVTYARLERSIVATDVVVAEYDWTHPTLPAKDELTGRSHGDPVLQIYDHTDIVTLYDYQNEAYNQNDAKAKARMTAERLELGRRRRSLWSTVVTAQSGCILRVTGCPDATLDGAYFVAEMSARGDATEGIPGTYENRMFCVPLDVPFRPARRIPHPAVVGPETAIVVGPENEEIHVDEHGRIRVQFHWDRQGELDENSSCWLRVMQAWSGPGWGSWWVPRIGMEVVVQFMGGNPDRPFVTGTLYNGDNRTPYTLPDEKTKSTIKSNSSPGGDGFNELRFEDKAGSEEIFVHAQKDYNEVVEHDHSTTVHNHQKNRVDHNHTVSVGDNQSTSVGGDRAVAVTGNESYTVQKDRLTSVTGSSNLTITGSYKVVVSGGAARGKATDPAAPGASLSVQGTYAVDASQLITQTVGNCTVSQDGSTLVVNAPTTIRLVVGDSTIEMSTSQITLTSPNIVALAGNNGATNFALDANALLNSRGTVTVSHDQGAQLVLTPNASLTAQQVNVEGGSGMLELAGHANLSGDTAELRGGQGAVACDGASVAVTGTTIKLN